jgi:hypothetical protein
MLPGRAAEEEVRDFVEPEDVLVAHIPYIFVQPRQNSYAWFRRASFTEASGSPLWVAGAQWDNTCI